MAFLMLIRALLGIGEVKDVGGFDKNNWMKDADGSALISTLSIPGTHNSGALYEPVYGTAKCQRYTINDQFNMGVRFLDVRASISAGKLKIAHGSIRQGSTLNSLLNDCYGFLEKNPSEAIILSLRNEDGELEKTEKFEQLASKEINSNARLWYTENRIPALNEVRGKIVLINRFNRYSNLGINAAHDWGNNCTFSLYNIFNTYNIFFINVQDVYSPSTIEEKKEAVLSFFKNNNKPAEDIPALCINFLNAVTSAGNIPETSAEMNKFFKEYSKTNPKYFVCIVFDYITSDLCDIVINANK